MIDDELAKMANLTSLIRDNTMFIADWKLLWTFCIKKQKKNNNRKMSYGYDD